MNRFCSSTNCYVFHVLCLLYLATSSLPSNLRLEQGFWTSALLTFERDNFWLWRTVLCILRFCNIKTLYSLTPATLPIRVEPYFQMLPNVPCRTKLSLVENHQTKQMHKWISKWNGKVVEGRNVSSVAEGETHSTRENEKNKGDDSWARLRAFVVRNNALFWSQISLLSHYYPLV